MFHTDDGWILAAGDAVDALECAHRTTLRLAHAARLAGAPVPTGTLDALVASHGTAHELRVIERLKLTFGDALVEIGLPAPTGPALRAAAVQTRAAMDRGTPAVVQAVLYDGRSYGRADILLRSDLALLAGGPREDADALAVDAGPVGYEPYDTKLARHAKPGAVLQLTAYAAAIGRTGRPVPRFMHLILGDDTVDTLRVADYLPLLQRIEVDLRPRLGALAVMPTPAWGPACSACATCSFAAHCSSGREQARDLSLIAGIRVDQRRKLTDGGLTSLDELAAAPDAQRPATLAERTFSGLRAQAALQQQQDRTRTAANPTGTVVLDVHSPAGLAMLPDPSPGDLFFDFEGDPYFAHGEGLEYLIGAVELTGGDRAAAGEQFTGFWAHDRAGEKRMFEEFMDFATARISAYPGTHLYHYAPYEPTALKKLAQLHGTRESEVDDLLREARMVDLYAVVRRSVRVSQRSYSIKYLEPLYMPAARKGDVTNAGSSIEAYERYLTLVQDGNAVDAATVLADIVAYNTDDCVSTRRLYDMLLGLRNDRNILYTQPIVDSADTARTTQREDPEQQTASLSGPLLHGLPDDPGSYSRTDRARALLASAVGYHRRETLPAWWEYFAMIIAPLSDLENNSSCAVPLHMTAADWVTPAGKTKLFKRRLVAGCDAEQPHPFRPDEKVRLLYAAAPGAEPLVHTGIVEAVAGDELTISEGTRESAGRELPVAILPGAPIRFHPKDQAVAALAALVIASLPLLPKHPGVDLLLAGPPRLVGGGPLPLSETDGGQDNLHATVISAVDALDGSYLPVQGPPGAGKTYLAGQLIRHLIGLGKTVGVCATSHHAIENALLSATGRRTDDQWQSQVPAAKKVGSKSDQRAGAEFEQPVNYKDVSAFRTAHPDGYAIGGTAWTFSHDSFRTDPVDYLIIDEAGQFALADALAVSMAARNIVLLGDPQQLPQVVQGVHPAGAGASALGHVLQDDEVVNSRTGYFLAETWRMHPDVCAPVSALSYRGLLHSDRSTTRRGLAGITSGLHYLAVASDGCTTVNTNEVAAVVDVITDLLGREWTDTSNSARLVSRPLTGRDILVVAPFNRMVHALQRAIHNAGINDVRIGTVDKFQGQEAPVVLTTMTASTGEDLPRGLEFLLSRNRLTVALSRAQAVSILICSPALARTTPTTVGQMRLVSGFAGLLTPADPTIARTMDLFAGAGGMSLGFTQSGLGFEPVLGVEVEPAAARTYERNFGCPVYVGPIEAVEHFESSDVIIGSPPWQGFSKHGRDRDSDGRAVLNQHLQHYLRAVRQVRPVAFVVDYTPMFERSPEFVRLLELMQTDLQLSEYAFNYGLLDAADYGVPQHRRRGIFVAIRGVDQVPWPPEPTHGPHSATGSPYVTVREALDGLAVHPTSPITNDTEGGQDLHFSQTPTQLALERHRAIPEGGNISDLARKRPDLLPPHYVDKPAVASGAMGRLRWDQPSRTVLAEFFMQRRYLHPTADRPITHREAARLQTFPDYFEFSGSKIEVARQIGNAVPPALAEAIARHLHPLIAKQLGRSPDAKRRSPKPPARAG